MVTVPFAELPDVFGAPCTDEAVSGLWTDYLPTGQRAAADQCAACHRIVACQDYAAKFQWCDVVIGGWLAPPRRKARPPWFYDPAARPLVDVDIDDISPTAYGRTRRRSIDAMNPSGTELGLAI